MQNGRFSLGQRVAAWIACSIALVTIILLHGFLFFSAASPFNGLPVNVEEEDLYTSSEPHLSPHQLYLSPRARMLASVEVNQVERREVRAAIPLFGTIDYDEHSVIQLTSWVKGRIERMYYPLKGTLVTKGEPLVEIYSPELWIAEEEFLAAIESSSHNSFYLRDRVDKMVEAARSKLRLLGLEEGQIERIETRKKSEPMMVIRAPTGGVIIDTWGREGAFVDAGSPIYTIADESKLLVKLRCFASDLFWVRYGQEVTFTLGDHPGKIFSGNISFIDPLLDKKSNSGTILVTIEDHDENIKVGSYVQALIQPFLTAEGSVQEFDHSLIDQLLVKAAMVSNHAGEQLPLVIPATAPLIMGRRTIVYVQIKGEEGIYEPREVVLGPKTKDVYIVREGLKEGELVVVKGNFYLDSAAALMGDR